jgi:hypothetical protein
MPIVWYWPRTVPPDMIWVLMRRHRVTDVFSFLLNTEQLLGEFY